jgi:hypothetical protein
MIRKILNKIMIKEKKLFTSFSDNGSYPSFCLNASINDKIFSTFRSSPIYDCIVDVINEEQGQLFYEKLLKHPDFLNEINEFKKNDLFGGPRLYNYSKVGEISPATLRYVNILYHLENIFGNLSNKTIVEIGIGYGGQARILNEKYNIKEYNLIDLKEVNKLAEKYLNKFPKKRNYKFHNIDNISFNTIDLFISNYAFSELKRELQEFYLENVILKSKSGYMLYNHINPPEFSSFTQTEIQKRIPNSKILEESPKTSDKNYIIYWNN